MELQCLHLIVQSLDNIKMATKRPKPTLRPKVIGSAAIPKTSHTGFNDDGDEQGDSREPNEEGGGESTDEDHLICRGL